MNSLQRYAFAAARVLVAVTFLASGFGIIPQALAAKELANCGTPASLVPLLMLVGRTIEVVGGFGLILRIYPQIAAFALIAFLVPATLVGHAFWCAAGTPAYPAASQFPEEHCDDRGPVVYRGNAQPTLTLSGCFAVNRTRTNH